MEFLSRCPNCNGKIRKRDSGQYVVPIFGFEALKCEDKIPMRKPIPKSRVRKFFIGDENIFNEKSIKNLKIIFAKRGKISVLNIDSKINLDTGALSKKAGSKSLGYNFYTDILTIKNIPLSSKNMLEQIYSLMYSLLEGASLALDIKREDIDATLFPQPGSYDIILFDNVPAGAGFMKAIYENFEKVLNSSLDLVSNCKCDEDTCCPLCLEHISNQYLANFLKRKEAVKLLNKIRGSVI